MSSILSFSPRDLLGAKEAAGDRKSAASRRRAYLNALARQTFLEWARTHDLTASLDGTYATDPDLVELLDLADVRLGDIRVNVVALYGRDRAYLRIDRRAVYCGFHADYYAFVDIAQDLDQGQLLGVAPLDLVLDRGWSSADGDYLLLDHAVLRPSEELLRPLAPAEAPDRVYALDHESVSEAIVDYENGELPAEERGPFEAHLFGCADCRRALVIVRFFKGAARLAGQAPTPAKVVDLASRRQRAPLRSARDLRSRLAAADARAVYSIHLETGSVVKAYVPDAAEAPRLTSTGLEGVLVLEDDSLDGRRVLVRIDIDFEGAAQESFALEVSGEELVLSHGLDRPEVQAWLQANVPRGKAIALSPDLFWLEALPD